MNEYEVQIALDRCQLRTPNTFDLLGHVLDIELVGNLARTAAEPADRNRLLLRPQQNVVVIESAHIAALAHCGEDALSEPKPTLQVEIYHTSRLCYTAAPRNAQRMRR